MKRKLFITSILAMALLFSISAVALADVNPMASTLIKSKGGSITKGSGENIVISFKVIAKAEMKTIGASSIELRTSGGSYVTTFYPSSYSNMLSSGCNSYESSINYKATSGQTYYAIISFYAYDGSESSTVTYTTSVGP